MSKNKQIKLSEDEFDKLYDILAGRCLAIHRIKQTTRDLLCELGIDKSIDLSCGEDKFKLTFITEFLGNDLLEIIDTIRNNKKE